MGWRRVAVVLVASAMALGAIWVTLQSVLERRARAELEVAKQDLTRGRYALARNRLAELISRRPGWDEACITWEFASRPATGRRSRARRFWSESRSGRAGRRGAMSAMRLELDRGRFSECERLLRRAAGVTGPHVAEARWGLVLLLRMEGRFDEARRWLQDGFDLMTSPVETLQRLYKLDVDPFPIEGVRLPFYARLNSA